MFIGQDKATGEMIDIKDAIKEPTKEYICPVCGEALVIKNGSIVTPHFAHKTLIDCDTFSHDMSAWHRWWQELFPQRNREHVETLQISVGEYKKAAHKFNFLRDSVRKIIKDKPDDELVILQHRADIRACGCIIEVQNTSISREEFNERNWFYQEVGCKVVWIFNFKEARQMERIQWIEQLNNSGYGDAKYQWNHAVKMFRDYLPHKHQKRRRLAGSWCDRILVFFQFEDYRDDDPLNGILEQVTWAAPNEYNFNMSNFKWFITSYKITTPQEFIQAVLNKRL